MEQQQPRAEVIVASTLYLISSWLFDPSPCSCRLAAIVAHLERMMGMEGLDPVLRATALQLHEHWQRAATRSAQTAALEEAQALPHHTWH